MGTIETPAGQIQAQAPEIHMVAKLSAATCGINPRAVLALPEDQPSMTLCQIVGQATNCKMKEGPDGTVHWPLVGRFQSRAVKPDGRVIITRSGFLYLPSGIHEAYEAQTKEAEKAGAVLSIALELRVVKAGNKIGYSYEVVDLAPPAQADPLTEMSNRILAGQGSQVGPQGPPEGRRTHHGPLAGRQ